MMPRTLGSMFTSDSRDDESALRLAVDSVQRLVARVVVGPAVGRGLHNQDALLENQLLASRHGAEGERASRLRDAYRELEPRQSRHVELIYLIEGADLFTEGRPWAVHYPPRAAVLVSRNTRLVVGRATPSLRAKLDRLIEAR